MKIATKLIKTEWPANDGVMPGNRRFDALLKSIKKIGIKEPIKINTNWYVIDGNHRLSAARILGIEYMDVHVWTGVEWVY